MYMPQRWLSSNNSNPVTGSTTAGISHRSLDYMADIARCIGGHCIAIWNGYVTIQSRCLSAADRRRKGARGINRGGIAMRHRAGLVLSALAVLGAVVAAIFATAGRQAQADDPNSAPDPY